MKRLIERRARIALVAIARPTFDVALAQETAEVAVATLEGLGLEMLGTGSMLVMDAGGCDRAIETLDGDLDLVVLLQATFADASMAERIGEAASDLGLMVMLWSVPEARTGGRLRLNSLCGMNLAGHALSQKGVLYQYLFASADDTVSALAVVAEAKARRLMDALVGKHIGLVGERPEGFSTCDYDGDSLMALFGVKVEKVGLEGVLTAAAEASAAERAPFLERARSLASNVDTLDGRAVQGTAGVHAALSRVVEGKRLAGVAVRCWPEFFTELGCAACGAMSVLNEAGCPASCEADVAGTVTSLILQELAESPAFLADLVSIDEASDTAVLWHCGLAPASMADVEEGRAIQATVHSNRKLPLLFEFGLRPGRVTVARLARRQAQTGDNPYALVIGRGEVVRAEKAFSGTSGVVRFDAKAAEVLNFIMMHGLEHHLSLVYGDCYDALEALGRNCGMDVLLLTS